ncbi:MAG: glycosyltransferase [Bacteroidales bacterium]|nr:glycosyltransferase [Bacteroidales bacterium]
MRILQVITSLGIGGAENLVKEFALRFNQQGIETDVLLLNGLSSSFKDELTDRGINVISLSNGSLITVYNPLHIFRIGRILKNYDIVHTHLFAAQYWTLFAKLLYKKDIKLITTEHNSINRRTENKLLGLIDKFVFSRYDKVVCISKPTYEMMQSVLNDESNLILIENGIDLSKISDALPYTKSELLNQPENIKLVLCVAGFREQKDQDTLIRSLKYLPEYFHLALAGDGVRRALLENLAKDESVSKRVHFLGVRKDISQLLKSSDYNVLSSHYEGLSLSCIEGMASGKPFLASNVSGLKEIVDGAGILFEHQNPKDFADKILELESDSKYKDEVVSKCLERAALYDINKCTDKYITLYKSFFI